MTPSTSHDEAFIVVASHQFSGAAHGRLARTFVELADTLVDDFDLLEFLHTPVDRCVKLLDVSASGRLLADSHDQLRLMASSAEEIHPLELFQLQNDDGPCLNLLPHRRAAQSPRSDRGCR